MPEDTPCLRSDDKYHLVWGGRPGQCEPIRGRVFSPDPRPREPTPPLPALPIWILTAAEISTGCRAVPDPPTRLPHPPGGQCTKGHFSTELQLHLHLTGLRWGRGGEGVPQQSSVLREPALAQGQEGDRFKL